MIKCRVIVYLLKVVCSGMFNSHATYIPRKQTRTILFKKYIIVNKATRNPGRAMGHQICK